MKEIEWISVTDKLPIGVDEPTGAILIAYDEAFFGCSTKEIDFGYFDHAHDYEVEDDDGQMVQGEYGTGTWRFWNPDREVRGAGVTHWALKPEAPND